MLGSESSGSDMLFEYFNTANTGVMNQTNGFQSFLQFQAQIPPIQMMNYIHRFKLF